MGSIDHSSMFKLDIYVIAHTKEKPRTIHWYLLQNLQAYESQKSEKNLDFDGWYIWTLTKEKSSKIPNIEVAILLFFHQNT